MLKINADLSNNNKKWTELFEPMGLEEWKAKIGNDLKGKEFEELSWKSPEGIDVKAVFHNPEFNLDT